MVKFPTKKSKKSAQVSPLMADEPEPASLSGRDKERESRKKDREERRKKRDKRQEDNKQSSEKSSKSKKKSSKPKLSQEEQDEKDANLGCCHKFGRFIVKAVHFVDAIIGLVFVVYGSLIYTQFDTPAMEAVITSLTFGSAMLFTSIMGLIGFYTKVCKRCGLVLSAYTAPFIAFFYFFVIIALLASPDVYFNYLTEHKDVLYLNDAEIASIRSLLPLFYIILASLAGIEIARFFAMRKLRDRLVRYDEASVRISERSASERSSRQGSKKSSKSKESSKSGLSDPLLDWSSGSDEDV